MIIVKLMINKLNNYLIFNFKIIFFLMFFLKII